MVLPEEVLSGEGDGRTIRAKPIAPSSCYGDGQATGISLDYSMICRCYCGFWQQSAGGEEPREVEV